MKTSAILLLCLSFIHTIGFAQSDGDLITTPSVSALNIPLNARQLGILDKTRSDKFVKQSDFVSIGDLPKIQKKGFLTFTLPRFGQVTAKALRVESYGENNYKWIGEINREHFGYVFLYKNEDKVYGHVSVDNRSYHIKAIGNGLSLLAETDMTQMTGPFCRAQGGQSAVYPPNPFTKGARIDPCNQSDPVRVLVLYTQRALDAVGLATIQERVNISVDQFNQAYYSSGVTNVRARLLLIGLEQTPFAETQNLDLSGLGAANGEINNLRNIADARRTATGADIMVCITDANYQNSFGTVNNNGINVQNGIDSYALVEIRRIPDQPVFPHEIGHLFGGRHDVDPTPGDNRLVFLLPIK